MVTKRVTPAKKTVRRKSAVSPEITDPNVRQQLIAAEAYFLAERRGFAAGQELADWAAAEAAVEVRLREMQAA